MRRATLGTLLVLLAGCFDRTPNPLAPPPGGRRLDVSTTTEPVAYRISVSADPFAAPVAVGGAQFGPAILSNPDFSVEGSVVRAIDAPDISGGNTFDACSPLTNAAAIAGNIALVDRGTCTFTTKVLNAQHAGAIGVIVRNNATGPVFQMGGADAAITIPAVLMTLSDGNILLARVTSGPTTARIFVEPTTPPTISVPADIVVETADPTGAIVTYTATGTRAGVTGPAVCATWPSGRRFPVGTTTVECSVTDLWGNTVSASFTVTVRGPDTEPPVVQVPAPIVTELTGPATIVTYAVSATDNVGVVGSPVCDAPSGSPFALGTTTVSCSATDAAGNVGSANFTVTIVDTRPPTLTVPSAVVADATSTSGAVVSYAASASDLSGNATVHCAPASGGVFVIGTTRVTCTATDGSGNVATAGFDVTVKSAAAQITDLQTTVGSLNLQEGTETSVQAKLSAALSALSSGNVSSACGSLSALINQVTAQSGKKISASDAQALIATIRRIQAAAGC